jgi:hypothetical protein
VRLEFRDVRGVNVRVPCFHLEAERGKLIALRESELWAAVYPDASASEREAVDQVAGGRTKYLEKAGITVQVSADRMLELLRDDARWARAMASPRQRAVLAGSDPDARQTTARWKSSDEALSEREKAQRAAYDREFKSRLPAERAERARHGMKQRSARELGISEGALAEILAQGAPGARWE